MRGRRELPAGFELYEAWEVPLGAPALQALIRMARYECVAVHAGGVPAAREAAAAFLRCDSVVHNYSRAEEEKSVDLRPLVRSIAVEPGPGALCRVALEVSIGQEGSARPEHVLEELGFSLPAESTRRVALSFESPDGETVVPDVSGH